MEFKCNHCTNVYKSYQSRWNHIKKVHNSVVTKPVVDGVVSVVDNVVDGCSRKTKCNTICKYCNSNFSDRIVRWRHEKICKSKETVNQQIINNNTTNNNIQNNNNGTINIDNSQKIINNFGNNYLELFRCYCMLVSLNCLSAR